MSELKDAMRILDYCGIEINGNSISRLTESVFWWDHQIRCKFGEGHQELLDRVETIEGLQRGLSHVKAGRTKPAPEVFNRLRRKHGLPR